VKTAKDLVIPYTWEQRRPILLDRILYVPTPFDHKRLDFQFFDDPQPVVIEFCSGNGQWICEKAKENPHLNWIAVEKRFERARQIWLKMHRQNIPNLFVVCGEALIFTRFYAKPASEIYINFPDPWPKWRHAKHRLITQEFTEALLQLIPSGGKVFCATDDERYSVQMVDEFKKVPSYQFLFKLNEWPEYGSSFFKELWKQKGRTIHYLAHEKL